MIKKTLYFGNPAYINLKDGQLVVRTPNLQEGDSRSIPIEDIGLMIIDNKQITFTSGVAEALLDNNVALITCNSQRMPQGLMLPLEGNTVQQERFEYQLQAKEPLKKQLWQQTIQQKILNQAAVLSSSYPKENEKVEIGCMFRWAKDVKSGDPTNLEARAAAYYWKNIMSVKAGMKKPSTKSIPEFKRDPDGEYPNNLLNYGYAILRACVARSLVGSGLLPTFGIHHHNRYNAYCLADDIMEPYRPYVDSCVLDVIQDTKYKNNTELSIEIKAKLLQIPVIDVIIDGKRSPLMIATAITTASLAKCFEGKIKKIIYPKMSEQ
ncbi:CRISPR-associated endonuclease Cas1 [Bacteroidia bacterium]|nr:CRISPR-associated endonuclease Cas1 [Bacteroidia bacterium]GHV42861.1 CRISPR-associated endonuclease Cas1 [Bacteroidia bacterium]